MATGKLGVWGSFFAANTSRLLCGAPEARRRIVPEHFVIKKPSAIVAERRRRMNTLQSIVV
jgi:hypothetical protein